MSEYENFNDPTIYLKNFSEDITDKTLLMNYTKLLETYHLLFKKNIVTKKMNYIDFIYKQGMKCIKHIFIFLLQHSNNLQFTYYHCEKGIYYFTEFISQIENENSFLKLSSIDAIIFVYKKTIYNINKKMSCGEKSELVYKISRVIDFINRITTLDNFIQAKEIYLPLLRTKKKYAYLEIINNEYEKTNHLIEELKKEL